MLMRFMDDKFTDEVWGQHYNDLEIKSDARVHIEVATIVKQLFLHKTDDVSVLDIAAGHGALTKRIQDIFPTWSFQINDLDHTNPLSGAVTSTIDLNGKFGETLPEFDLVLCIEVIEHLENPWNLFRELRKVVRPGGTLILSTPNSDSILDRIEYLKYGHAFYFGKRGFVNSGGHITPVPDWLMRKIATESGFEIKELNFVSTKPFVRKYMLPEQFLLKIYLRLTHKNYNDRSINIYVLK